MTLSIHTTLEYDFYQPTDVLLQLEAAIIPEQAVTAPYIAISPVEHFARVPGQDLIGDRIWLRLQGRLTVDYTAQVRPRRMIADWSRLPAIAPHLLPGEAVQYMLPSRYCPSDKFESLVEAEFGGTAGGARISAIRDWIAGAITYRAGTSTSSTDAMDTYVTRQGVCRDFAHLLVALARASVIPARFVSVYAPDVAPQDFHAVAEVFLDGAWHLVDPTGMAKSEEMAKIGVGRDAADVSFLTSYGSVSLVAQTVDVQRT
ncbi:MAG: transglutaminase family protein [Novosphingobium sp.]